MIATVLRSRCGELYRRHFALVLKGTFIPAKEKVLCGSVERSLIRSCPSTENVVRRGAQTESVELSRDVHFLEMNISPSLVWRRVPLLADVAEEVLWIDGGR